MGGSADANWMSSKRQNRPSRRVRFRAGAGSGFQSCNAAWKRRNGELTRRMRKVSEGGSSALSTCIHAGQYTNELRWGSDESNRGFETIGSGHESGGKSGWGAVRNEL